MRTTYEGLARCFVCCCFRRPRRLRDSGQIPRVPRRPSLVLQDALRHSSRCPTREEARRVQEGCDAEEGDCGARLGELLRYSFLAQHREPKTALEAKGSSRTRTWRKF